MSAKLTLIGQPQNLRTDKDGIVTFKIVTGPASNTAPKGLVLYKAVTLYGAMFAASVQSWACQRT